MQTLSQLNSLLLYLRYWCTSEDMTLLGSCVIWKLASHIQVRMWVHGGFSLWEQSWVADEPFHLTRVWVICVGWRRDMGCLLPKSNYLFFTELTPLCGLYSSCHWNLWGCSFCNNYLPFLTPATIPFCGCAMLVYLTYVIVGIAYKYHPLVKYLHMWNLAHWILDGSTTPQIVSRDKEESHIQLTMANPIQTAKGYFSSH